MKKTEKETLSGLIGTLVTLLQKNAKLYTWITISVCAAVGFASAVSTALKQRFFEYVSDASKGGSLSSAVWSGIFLGIFLAVTLAFQGLSDILTEDLTVRLSGFLGLKVNEKAGKIDPVCFEDTEMLNDINKAYQGVKKSGEVMGILLIHIAFYVPYFLFFLIYLFRIHPALCIGMILIFIPTIGGHFIRKRHYTNLENTAAPIRRRMEYYESCIAAPEYVKETRLLGAVWFFKMLYESTVLLFKKEQWKTQRKSAWMELLLRMASLLVYIIILCLLYYYLSTNVINTAVFAAIFTSIDQMFNYMDYVGYSLGDLSCNLPAAENTMRFLKLPERKGREADIKNYSVRLDQVSFQYPNRERNVLNSLNLFIEEGETIAIVGENGAGKSTLVKLLMGIYLPTDGDVFIGENNTKELSPQSIFRGISSVFQKFQRYRMKLTDNITISDSEERNNIEKLKSSLLKARLNIEEPCFNEGLETMLSREFGGSDLSGGQWQRVAIGRGIYRSHSMIILDEPTAAVDPVEETRIYKQFGELSQNKTAVIVTHRLGSAKIADRIIVMEEGRIVETGTHDQLIAQKGRYSNMYASQLKWYE